MIKFYKDLMDKKVANDIYVSFMQLLLNGDGSINKEFYEDDNPTTNYSTFGVYNLNTTYVDVDKYDRIIKKDFGNNYEFTHSFLRVYANGGLLHPHIDKKDLDLTLTVNVHSMPEQDWKINFSNKLVPEEEMEDAGSSDRDTYTKILKKYLDDYSSFETHIGDGVCCIRNVVHWRDEFKSSFPGEHYMQVFYHWKKI
jgi:hypothetical protein